MCKILPKFLTPIAFELPCFTNFTVASSVEDTQLA